MEVLKQWLSNESFMGCAMAAIIFGLTFLLKLPIKALTKNHSKNERARKIKNVIIVLIPFLLGLLAEFLYSCLYLHISFIGIKGLSYGAGAISLYAAISQFFKQKLGIELDNPIDTEEGKAVQDLVEKVQKDGKVDKSDISAVDEFWKTIQKDKK